MGDFCNSTASNSSSSRRGSPDLAQASQLPVEQGGGDALGVEQGADIEGEGPAASSKQRKRRQQQHQGRAAALEQLESSNPALAAQVPLDFHGRPTSIGSVGHYKGECQVC